jgi:hypothetical protein
MLLAPFNGDPRTIFRCYTFRGSYPTFPRFPQSNSPGTHRVEGSNSPGSQVGFHPRPRTCHTLNLMDLPSHPDPRIPALASSDSATEGLNLQNI